jgi:hypothetical protein
MVNGEIEEGNEVVMRTVHLVGVAYGPNVARGCACAVVFRRGRRFELLGHLSLVGAQCSLVTLWSVWVCHRDLPA